MTSKHLISLFFGWLVLVSCGGGAPARPAPTWSEVESLKRAWTSASEDQREPARQAWADALGEFVIQHPDHEEAGREWNALALEFARSLTAQGRYRAAVRYFETVLARNPDDETVAGELAQARERMALTRETLEQIRLGMTRDDVREKLGPPQPGWSESVREGPPPIEAWFYPREDGGVASIHFVDGKVFDVDAGS